MAEPLTSQPFLALHAAAREAGKVTPIRSGVHKRAAPNMPISSKRLRELMALDPQGAEQTLVSQPRQPSLPGDTPPETAREPEPVAAKKKRSPESIAKMKATLAAKREAGWRPNKKKKRKYERSPESIAKQRATLAKKKRQSANGELRAPRLQRGTSEASLSDLLGTIIEATTEISRRLSQLSL